VADQACITIKVDIGEAARRVLISHYLQRKAELNEISAAVFKAQRALDEFMYQCGLPDEVKLVPANQDTAVQE
jgi:hypothetical protein